MCQLTRSFIVGGYSACSPRELDSRPPSPQYIPGRPHYSHHYPASQCICNFALKVVNPPTFRQESIVWIFPFYRGARDIPRRLHLQLACYSWGREEQLLAPIRPITRRRSSKEKTREKCHREWRGLATDWLVVRIKASWHSSPDRDVTWIIMYEL